MLTPVNRAAAGAAPCLSPCVLSLPAGSSRPGSTWVFNACTPMRLTCVLHTCTESAVCSVALKFPALDHIGEKYTRLRVSPLAEQPQCPRPASPATGSLHPQAPVQSEDEAGRWRQSARQEAGTGAPTMESRLCRPTPPLAAPALPHYGLLQVRSD
ncbi:hypothetical protein BT67DRAFT_205574 [Trichocladium antarcticum]|uniref:Uncharacterized protein n=1 Tax=Trichocladium antarcticum TaxID=1450529 RepID=A0AAN6UFX6_9PEZI|nr:hypothetical protein BT67DRAFT_205574 [Trichocladium antarcticum]